MPGSRGSDELAALLQAMLDSSLDAVVTMAGDGRVLMFNRAAETMFGYLADDVVGRDVAELIIPPSLRTRHYAALSRFLETREPTILGRRVELTGMRSDGSEFPIELTVTGVPLDGPPVFTAYLRDITDRKRAEQDLLESRTRVVEVADRERRRIERNLHDGAQQRLVAILLLLRRMSLEGELPAKARDILAVATDETARAIEELRDLARGIHPAALTEAGLASALRGLALRCPVDVEVDVAERRLAESVETAFYYTAAEALANVAKHAGAGQARIQVRTTGSAATLVITDDGRGGADTDAGSGLLGLADRITALGGTLTIESPPGRGTTIEASVPTA
jgi:PAS domain S-box-containing protein